MNSSPDTLRFSRQAADILETIVAQKRVEVAGLPVGNISASRLRERLKARGGVRDFAEALRRPNSGNLGLIAEVKKASPSAGVLCEDFDPVRIAREFESAGANCLSVLTDKHFFQGALSFLRDIRTSVSLPLLRKDFIIDERQILEAVEWGADAILLIVAILPDAELSHFHSLAEAAGLSVLVEVHDENELERAMRIGCRLLGINNRNLKTFQVDLGTTERLAARLRAVDPEGRTLLVAESGINNRADVLRVQRASAGAILVGESLMRSPNMRIKAAELMGRLP